LVTGVAAGTATIRYVVAGSGGCANDTATRTVTINALPTVTADDASVCVGLSVTLSASPSGGLWTMLNGSGSLSGASYTAGSSAGVATFRYTYTDPTTTCVNSDDATVTINAKPDQPSITADKLVCLGKSTPLFGSPSSPGVGTWTVVSGGGEITSGGVYSTPLSRSEYDIAAVVRYIYTNTSGCSDSSEVTIRFADCSNFCTYSQGYYGNPGGKSCVVTEGGASQETTIARIQRAFNNYQGVDNQFTPGGIKNAVVFGSGNRTFTIREDVDLYTTILTKQGSSARIFALLPGGGSATLIPEHTQQYGAWNSDNGKKGGPLVSQPNNSVGKINSSLLAQTVAMWINMWASQNNLAGWELPATFITSDVKSCGTFVPVAGTEKTYTTPGPLVGKTVKELIDLANLALGGQPLGVQGLTSSMIHGMLGTLVDAFHGCKTLAVPVVINQSRFEFGGPVFATATEVTVKEEPKADVTVKAFPNPYVDQVTFNITVKNAGKGSLVLYNAIGQRVANVFEGDMQANSTQTIRYSVPVSQRKSLVYVFRQNGNTSTGRLVSGK